MNIKENEHNIEIGMILSEGKYRFDGSIWFVVQKILYNGASSRVYGINEVGPYEMALNNTCDCLVRWPWESEWRTVLE